MAVALICIRFYQRASMVPMKAGMATITNTARTNPKTFGASILY